MGARRMIRAILPFALILVLMRGKCSAIFYITCLSNCYKDCRKGGGGSYFCAMPCFNCCFNHVVCHCLRDTSCINACAESCLNLSKMFYISILLHACIRGVRFCLFLFRSCHYMCFFVSFLTLLQMMAPRKAPASILAPKTIQTANNS